MNLECCLQARAVIEALTDDGRHASVNITNLFNKVFVHPKELLGEKKGIGYSMNKKNLNDRRW